MVDPTHPACPSCGAAEARVIGALPDVSVFARTDARDILPKSTLFRCIACDLAFRHPTLAASVYDDLYGKVDPATWPGGLEREDWALVAGYLTRNAPEGAAVLDFGCHTGGLLQRIGRHYALTGIEINEQAAKVARAQAGADVFRDLASLPRGRRFDVVAAVDVVEHFADPGRVIASLLEVVKPGGALVITTGDADAWLWKLSGPTWWYCCLPEHLAFISERWMRNWLRRNAQPACLAEVRRFRHVHHPRLRYVRYAVSTLFYRLAPDAYLRLVRRAKRALGRDGGAYPPGSGLTRDHLFLVLEKPS